MREFQAKPIVPQGNWPILLIASSGNRTETTLLDSAQYGSTWNTTPSEGIDAVRYFTSQGGASDRFSAPV